MSEALVEPKELRRRLRDTAFFRRKGVRFEISDFAFQRQEAQAVFKVGARDLGDHSREFFVEPGNGHRPTASPLCMAMEKLDGLQPEPQIVAGSDADLRLLRDVGRARTALTPAVVKIEQTSDRRDKPHLMRQVSPLRHLDYLVHGQLATEVPALAPLAFCRPVPLDP